MNKRPAYLKQLLWTYTAVEAFTAITVIIHIILDHLTKRDDNNDKSKSLPDQVH